MRLLFRLVPKRVQRRLIRLVPETRRMALVRRLSRLKLGFAAGSGGARTVWRRGRPVRAHVETVTTPAQVRQFNVDIVVACLETLELPYFRVPTENPYKSVIGLPKSAQPIVREQLPELLKRWRPVRRWVRKSGRPVLRDNNRPAILRVYRPVTDARGCQLLGAEYACEIEFWKEDEDRLLSPRRNPITDELDATARRLPAEETAFSSFTAPEAVGGNATRPEFLTVPPTRVTFPVDVVYTWVDGDDPAWRERKQLALGARLPDVDLNPTAASDSRFTNRDELRYSLRSLACYAPWVRHVYIVTDDQTPPWLDTGHPRVTMVSHRDVFGDTGKLPTFNSHAIESRLHRIEGLSEHFLYLNDDMFFGRPLSPDAFFTANGLSRFFPSPAKVDLRPPSVQDSPVDAAAKNNRAVIAERFGVTTVRKMKHIMYPLRRSVLAEINRELSDLVEATASHQFRHPADLSIPSSLHHYWSFLTGRAVPGELEYMYADLTKPSTPVRLSERLARRDLDVFCLNDTDTAAAPLHLQHSVLSDFLNSYFPFPSVFEKQEPTQLVPEHRIETADAPAGTAPAGADAPAVR